MVYSQYPPNPRGVILALDQLRALLAAAGSLSAHIAAPDPHPQYALDTDLAAYATTASLSGYATTTALNTTNTNLNTTNTNLSNHTSSSGLGSHIPGTGLTDSHVATTANIAWTKIGKTGADATDIGGIPLSQKGAINGVATLDSSTKVPFAQLPTGTGSANVAVGNDSRIVNADAHRTTNLGVHGLPANAAPVGMTSAGRIIQMGTATPNGSIIPFAIQALRDIAVSFPVAFTATPTVTTASPIPSSAISVSTTGFTVRNWSDSTFSTGNYPVDWHAIGAG